MNPLRRITIGCLGCDVSEEVTRLLWQGVAEAARELDFNLLFFAGGGLNDPLPHRRPANVIYDLVHPQRVDGLVVLTSTINFTADPAGMRAFMHRLDPLPLVSIEETFPGIPAVIKDDVAGMSQAVEHLITVHRKRRILFIQGPASATARDRLRGYREALVAHGLPFDPGLVVPPPNSWAYQEGLVSLRAFLDERALQPRFDFDAVAASNDDNAMAAIALLQEKGVRVPDDVAVTGFDDLAQSGSTAPPLTTVGSPFRTIGRKAVELLAGRMHGEAVAPPLVLPPRLIVRHSCGCLLPSIAEAVLDESNGTNMAGTSDGGNPISRDEKPDLAGVLAGQRRGLLSEMAHAAGGSPFAQIEAARLLNGLVGELQHGTSGAFLSALDETLNQVAQRGERIKDWQSAISVLHRRIQPYIASGSLYARASDLWHQARVMIAEASWRNQSWKRIQNEEQERRLRDFGARLATVLEEEELAEVLARELPDLGVPRGLLSVYTDPRSPSGQAQLFMGCDSGGRLRLQAGEEIFPAPQLAPERFWMDEERFSMLVQPLYLRDLRLGFMLLETEGQASSRESVLWEALHTQISGALASVMLHREAVHARREAEAGWKLAEERRREAEDANQLKSRFLSMVSHEMRTPLNVIAGLSESLIQQSETHDPVSEDLAALYRDIRRIYASAQHLDNLIRDVLDLAVSQVGQLKILREPLDVAETILPVIELGERLAGEKHLTWQVHLEPDLPPVLYDRTRLRQILINLVTNAVKFTDQGSVELSVARSDGEVRFSVRDTGLGIAPEEQSMIFEEFRRSERAGARGYGGMGLGLAICRRLVEMGGGKIRVESSGEVGGGSTFTFAFPELTENTPLAAAPSSQVLVLHDQENSSLVAQLGAAGFQVEQLRVTADTAWHAFILTAPPAAVVLEFSPDNSLGAEIAAGFKNDPVLVNIPILFCTLESGYGALYELKTLQKPVAAPQLVQALEREGFGSPRDNPCPILVVDDEPGNLDLHARLIERHLPGCRVQRAHNGREALEVMRAEPPGLVLLDLMMPEMNGFDVLEAMRLSETLRAVPVIVLTSQKLTEREMQLLNQGVQAVLQKGIFSAEETLAHLKAALRRGKHLGSEARRIARLAMAFIHEHYRDPIARKDLAEAGGVSQEYLSTCFHRETGITPSEYLERYRIQQARRLLETTDLPVTRVALEVGFYDSSYFGRVFRREVGVTPVAYRRGERQG